MIFWIFFAVFLLILVLFKVYIIWGFHQAFRSKIPTIVFGIFSIGTLAAGVVTMFIAFGNGIIGMKFWQNFTIALMVSVLMCEILLAVFFFTDDVAQFGTWVYKRFFKKQSEPAPETAEKTAPHQQDKSRRRFLKMAGIGLASLPFASFLWGITKGKYNFKVFEKELAFADLPDAFDGFKFVQFSDLHSGGFDSFEDVKRGIGLIQEQNPDMILFTGDLVNDLEAEVIPYKPMLSALHAPMGKYSVLGNHDYPQDPQLFPDEASGEKNLAAIKVHHKEMGFGLLNNANVLLTKGDQSIRLIGVENWGNGFIQKGDLDKAIEGTQDDEFSILMSHDPTHWEEVVLKHNKHIHLTLAGHTHGMQMGIELFGLQWSPVQYLYKRWAGLYKELGQYIYVNRGFGFMAFAGRVGIPPEITVITLKKATA